MEAIPRETPASWQTDCESGRKIPAAWQPRARQTAPGHPSDAADSSQPQEKLHRADRDHASNEHREIRFCFKRHLRLLLSVFVGNASAPSVRLFPPAVGLPRQSGSRRRGSIWVSSMGNQGRMKRPQLGQRRWRSSIPREGGCRSNAQGQEHQAPVRPRIAARQTQGQNRLQTVFPWLPNTISVPVSSYPLLQSITPRFHFRSCRSNSSEQRKTFNTTTTPMRSAPSATGRQSGNRRKPWCAQKQPKSALALIHRRLSARRAAAPERF